MSDANFRIDAFRRDRVISIRRENSAFSSVHPTRQKLSTLAYEAACTQKRFVEGSVGEREDESGEEGRKARCVRC